MDTVISKLGYIQKSHMFQPFWSWINEMDLSDSGKTPKFCDFRVVFVTSTVSLIYNPKQHFSLVESYIATIWLKIDIW